MSNSLLVRPNPRKFVKVISQFSKKVSHRNKGKRETRNMLKKSNKSFKLKHHVSNFNSTKDRKKHLDLSKPCKTINVDKQSCRFIHYDGRSKVESLLLEQCQKLFTLALPRSAIERLVKKKAKRIASSLNVNLKQFQASKKWLKTFIKQCEQLGYLSKSDSVSKNVAQNYIDESRIFYSTCFNKESANSILETHQNSDLLTLFENNHNVETVAALNEQETQQNRDLLQLFESSNVNNNNVETPSTSCEQDISENATQTVAEKVESLCTASYQSMSSVESPNSRVDSLALLSRKSKTYLNRSKVISKSAFNESLIGLLVRNQDDLVEQSSECSPGVYDQLFQLVNPDIDCSEKLQSPGYSIDSLDSGYRSRSVSKSDDQSEAISRKSSIQTCSSLPTLSSRKRKRHKSNKDDASSKSKERDSSTSNVFRTCSPSSGSTNMFDVTSSVNIVHEMKSKCLKSDVDTQLSMDPLATLFNSNSDSFSTDLNSIDRTHDVVSSVSHDSNIDVSDPLIDLFTSNNKLFDVNPDSNKLDSTAQDFQSNSDKTTDPLCDLFLSSYTSVSPLLSDDQNSTSQFDIENMLAVSSDLNNSSNHEIHQLTDHNELGWLDNLFS